jgi:PAS domain S-box-containing protein
MNPFPSAANAQLLHNAGTTHDDLLSLTMRLSTTLASISEAFVTLDLKYCFTYVNRESERLLQRLANDLIGKNIWQVFDIVAQDTIKESFERALSTNNRVDVDVYFEGIGQWTEVRIHPFAEGLAVYFRDISERKAAEDKIYHLAFYDALTALPNRQLLLDRLDASLLASANTLQFGALMFIDLDNFKTLNDTLGHLKGDLLLQKVATRLLHCVRVQDTVARLGGG